jgi:DNA polymerase
MPVCGEGRRGILVVGDAPGAEEDKQNRQFVDKTGQRLRATVAELGIDLDRDCWTTNALVCRPPGNKIPDPKMVEYCRPNLLSTIDQLKPSTIILLGAAATESVINHVWKDEGELVMGKWAGWRIPCRQFNAWVCPTWHPSHVERSEEEKDRVTSLWWCRHLASAFALEGRPWPHGAPDDKRRVKCVQDPDEAARLVNVLTDPDDPRPVSFDYETDRLKPDHPEAKIACVALCRGGRSLAFPWQGAAVQAFTDFLKSPVPKRAFNIKMEARWTRRLLGGWTGPWDWDSMPAAHVLDNRQGIKSLKFQAFVRLGAEPWEGKVAQYLTSEGGDNNSPNRVFQCPVNDLLLYCGLDAFYEEQVTEHQKRELTEEEDSEL